MLVDKVGCFEELILVLLVIKDSFVDLNMMLMTMVMVISEQRNINKNEKMLLH